MEYIIIGIIVIFVSMGIATVISRSRNNSLPSQSNRHNLNGHNVNSSRNNNIQWRDIKNDNLSRNNNIQWIDVNNKNGNHNVPPDLIHWVDIPPDPEPEVRSWEIFRNHIPDDLDNILQSLIGCHDLYTQEKLKSGNEVYVCRKHRIGLLPDTWNDLQKCPTCNNADHVGRYTLPNV